MNVISFGYDSVLRVEHSGEIVNLVRKYRPGVREEYFVYGYEGSAWGTTPREALRNLDKSLLAANRH